MNSITNYKSYMIETRKKKFRSLPHYGYRRIRVHAGAIWLRLYIAGVYVFMLALLVRTSRNNRVGDSMIKGMVDTADLLSLSFK